MPLFRSPALALAAPMTAKHDARTHDDAPDAVAPAATLSPYEAWKASLTSLATEA